MTSKDPHVTDHRHPVPDDAWAPDGAFARDPDAREDEPRRRLRGVTVAAIAVTALSVRLDVAPQFAWRFIVVPSGSAPSDAYDMFVTIVNGLSFIAPILGLFLAIVSLRSPGRDKFIGALCLGVNGTYTLSWLAALASVGITPFVLIG